MITDVTKKQPHAADLHPMHGLTLTPGLALTFRSPRGKIIAPPQNSMPAVLKIDARRRIVSTTFHGQVTTEELVRHGETILANARFRNDFADLIDLSSVSITAINEDALRALATGPSIFGPDVPHVIIAPTDLPHELAMKYRDLSRQTRPNLHVVRTLQEARDLLARLGYEL